MRLPIGAAPAMAISAVALGALSLMLAQPLPSGGPVAPHVFEYLFSRNEPQAAWLAIAVVLASAALARWGRVPGSVVSRLTADPRAFVAGVTLVLAAAALLVYRAHPLSMDEVAPLFQARVFARGRLAGQVPPELMPRLVPPFRWFIETAPSGAMLSAYWPGFALLLTPFVWIGCPWLLNPLLGGATLLLAWRLAGRLWPGTRAAGWAVLFTAASPAFSVNAISFYSMAAHLAASLCFAALVIEERLFLAGVVGSLALALHNPLPHTLFALPWIAWLAWRPGRLRNLLVLALGYMPGVIVLVGGWMWCRASVTHPVETRGGVLEGLMVFGRSVFAAPSLDLLLARTMNVAELASWAVPLLVPLAVLGFVRCRADARVRLFALSSLLTLAGYAFVVYDQGHGWGFRYFHAAWGALPLLAAGGLESVETTPPLRKLALAAALFGLLFCTPLRFRQVRTFIDEHLAQVPSTAGGGRQTVVFIDVGRGSYTIDLVQNDPFLEADRWMLISFGELADRSFMRAFFPSARRIAAGAFGSVWQVD
ncbi:MAG TPA: hypothetical protein VN177_01940 [Myxococcales bacterium]|nr:hypothetical protein [Myxococcales bacterium]